jgi:hypothetical protein
VGSIKLIRARVPGILVPAFMVDHEEALPANRSVVLERRPTTRARGGHTGRVPPARPRERFKKL